MLATFALGAEAVQIGSGFAVTEESSAHDEYKRAVIESKEGDTILSLKQLTPVRLLKNEFYLKVKEAEEQCASKEKLTALLGKGRSKKGIFEGDLIEGELEVGQVAAQINKMKSAAEVVFTIWGQFLTEKDRIARL